MNAFDFAAQGLGLNESQQKAALQDYLTTGGQNLDPSVTAWCAAFVNAAIQKSGGQGTGSNMARSFLNWGQSVDQPKIGDIAVFSRGDRNGPYGHVGFFDGYNQDGTIRVLGGNQGDSVSVSSYSPDNLLGFRRAGGAAPTQGRNALGQPNQQQATQNALSQPVWKAAVLDPNAFANRNPFTAIPYTG